MEPRLSFSTPPWVIFFRTLLPVREEELQVPETMFSNFWKQMKEMCPHLYLYISKTYKCAVTVFTFLTKIQRKTHEMSNAPTLDFGAMFAKMRFPSIPPDHFECISASILAPFYLPTGIRKE